ncbi:MAG: hypothetical protein E7668_01285 [Ruminococcaceae bacterium]|nr:hypothetical protein [Oscillospiraceae bacterium]
MKKLFAAVAVLLAMVLVGSPVATAAEPMIRAGLEHEAADPLDFSAPYSLRAVISPADLVSLLLEATGEEGALSEEERAYLNDYYPSSLYYSERLPADLVSAQREAEGQTVTAQAYSYIGANGGEVVYLPIRAVCGGQTLSPVATESGYVFSFADAEAEVTVYYGGFLTVAEETAQTLLNFAFREAEAARTSGQSFTAYTAALAEYRQYLRALEEYEAKRADYEGYLAAVRLYEQAKIEYEKNRADLLEYEKKEQAYRAYLTARQTYLAEMEAYRTAYAEYETVAAEYLAYLENLGRIRSSTHAMESLFTKPEGVRCLYEALQNEELVLMFERYRNILSDSFGVPSSDIDAIRAYSDELNGLLREYATAREESEEAAFAFYQKNYERISRLFTYLYEKMTAIMTPTIYNLMCGKIELEYGKEASYKKWRIKNVLCHIYLICLCLDDTKTAEKTWSFFADDGDPHIYYFSDLLDQKVIITDTDAADPAKLHWMAEVERVEPPVPPAEPKPIVMPIKPPTLSEPQKPAPQSEPQRPAEVAEPTVPEDIDHALLLRTQGIQTALADGRLTEREIPAREWRIALPEVAQKAVSSEGVGVYGADGERMGLSADSLPDAMEGLQDAFYEYTFAGWSVSLTEKISPEGREESCIYALYTAKPKRFTVTFRSGDRICEETFALGEMPTYPDASPTKESDAQHDYVFSTWSPSLRPVRADCSYEACFLSEERQYTVTFRLGDRSLSRTYGYGEEPICPVLPVSFIKEGSFYEFSGWDREFVSVESDAVYTAQYRQTVLAALPDQAEGSLLVTETPGGYSLETSGSLVLLSGLWERCATEDRRLTVSFTDTEVSLSMDAEAIADLVRQNGAALSLLREEGEDGKGIGVAFTDREGKTVFPMGYLRLELPHGFDSDENIYARGYYAEGFYNDQVASESEGGRTALLAESGVYYKLMRRFLLTVVSGENGSAYAERTLWNEREAVALFLDPHAEQVVSNVVMTRTDTGEVIVQEDPTKPVMPSCHATITVAFAPKLYTVTFVWHGKTESAQYRLGDEVTVPKIDTSFEENGYFYTFIGWSSPIVPVTSDATYTAKFYSVKIEEVSDNGEGGAIGGIVRRLGPPVALAVLVVAVAVAMPPVALVILHRKKKNRKIKKKTKETNDHE